MLDFWKPNSYRLCLQDVLAVVFVGSAPAHAGPSGVAVLHLWGILLESKGEVRDE